MSDCWIGVAAGRHVAAGVAGGFAMFAHGRHEAVKKVRPGDWVAYYAPREGINEGAAIRAFTAMGYALPGEPRQREMFAGITGWSRDMHWLDASPADIYPLLDRFSFVRDRRHWGMAFRRSLFTVEDRDFLLIAEAMGVAQSFETRRSQP